LNREVYGVYGRGASIEMETLLWIILSVLIVGLIALFNILSYLKSIAHSSSKIHSAIVYHLTGLGSKDNFC